MRPPRQCRVGSCQSRQPLLPKQVVAFLPSVPLRPASTSLKTHNGRAAQPQLLTTCSVKATPPSNVAKTKISRRMFLTILTAAIVSTQSLPGSQDSPPISEAAPAQPHVPGSGFETSAWDGYGFEPDFPQPDDVLFMTEHFISEEYDTPTYDEYIQATRIPPIDYKAVLRNDLLSVLAVGFPVALVSTISALSFRASPRLQLPVFYDANALKRYFSIRLDVVVRRLAQFAAEGFALACGLLTDRLSSTTDNVLTTVRLQTPKTREKRALGRGQKRGVSLRNMITRLGPAVIKLGQAAASRPDLFSAVIVRELQPLQDDVSAVFSTEQAFAVIREELSASVHTIFDEIDPEPVAGASLGMVYKASVEGTDVAVKVQLPEVGASIALDCYILRRFADVAMNLFGTRTNWRAAVDEYASRLFEELDYRNEVENMLRFRETYSDVDNIYLPRVFPEYCSRLVLVTEWIDGEKLIDDDVNVRPEDLGLVETGIRFALTQLLDKGLLHADMHNGNMFRTKSGYLAYIDFGLVSEVPVGVRESIVCALVHLFHGEYSLLAETLCGMEVMRSDDLEVELPVLTEALREAFEPEESSKYDLQGMNIRRFDEFTLIGIVAKLLILGSRFPLVFRDYFLSNLRCLGMLEGLALNADPNFHVLSVVYPFVVKKILTGSTPRYRHALESLVIDSYGRMRWARIDQLLVDAQASRTRMISKNSASSVSSTNAPAINSQDFAVKDNIAIVPDDKVEKNVLTQSTKKRNEGTTTAKELATTDNLNTSSKKRSRRSARAVLRFITSDAGHFLRRYFTQQYLLNVERIWRKRIDEFFGQQKVTTNEERVVSMPLVNATSSVSRNAASRWLALHATARELSDDEARVRTREFFRSTPFWRKVSVLMRLIPGSVIPCVRTIFGIVVYLVHRWMHALFQKRQSGVDQESGKNDNIESNEGMDKSVSGPAVLPNEDRKWRAFESSFSRRTREADLDARTIVT